MKFDDSSEKRKKEFPLLYSKEADRVLSRKTRVGTEDSEQVVASTPKFSRRGNFVPAEDVKILRYVLGMPSNTWSGRQIYQRFAAVHNERTWESWRNRIVKHIKKYIDEYELTGSLAGVPLHIAQVLKNSVDITGSSVTELPQSLQPRKKRSRKPSEKLDSGLGTVPQKPTSPVVDVSDSDDSMFRDERPPNLLQEEEPDDISLEKSGRAADKESPSKEISENQRSSESVSQSTNPRQTATQPSPSQGTVSQEQRPRLEAISPPASDDDDESLFYGSQSPMSSPPHSQVPHAQEEVGDAAVDDASYVARDSSVSLGSPDFVD